MKRLFVLFLLLSVCTICAKAQTYNMVTVPIDTQFFGNDYVVVSKTGFASGNSTMGCNTPYWIGLSQPNSFTYTFSEPVSIIRLEVFAINTGERIAVYGNNGTRFNLSGSNLSVFNCGTTNMATTSGGYLEHSSGTYSNATVTINFPSPVDSVRIAHINGYGGGATYSFGFIWDTAVVVRQPFNDTVTCAGKSLQVSYDVNTRYNSNNVFAAQLSDATGSFANPVTIGTVTKDTGGTISCTIPNTTGNGTGYKIRIKSSSPVRYSEPHLSTIAIGNIDSAGVSFSGNSPVCIGNALSLVGTCNVQGSTYIWTGPNSFYSQQASPYIASIPSTGGGDYYATVNFHGCTVKDTIPVALKASPDKPVAYATTPICARDTLKLAATCATSNVNFSWTGPDNFSSTAQNPEIINAATSAAGSYIVTVDKAGCSRKDTVVAVVNVAPAIVTAQNNGPICGTDSLKISIGTSTTGTTYSWTGPGNFNASTQNTYIANSTVNATGWYVATLNLNGCIFKDSTYAVVKQKPQKPTATYNNPLCTGETLLLASTTVTNAIYNWEGPGNFTSTQQNPVKFNIQVGDTGTYSVKALLNGCVSERADVKVTVNSLPFVVIQANPGDTICSGSPAVFTPLPNNHGGVPTYQWYVNGMATGSSGSVFTTTTLNDADVVTCKMTEFTKCFNPYTDESNDIKMTVMPWLAPSVKITASPNKVLDPGEMITFTATPTNGGLAQVYQWKVNGKNITGAKSYTWGASTLNDNDVVSVEMFSSYRCPQPPSALSNTVVVRVYTGIDDVAETTEYKLYPNPNKGSFMLEGDVKTNEAMGLEILNTMGQVVYTANVQPVNKHISVQVNTGSIASGMYLIKLHTKDHMEVLRFRVD